VCVLEIERVVCMSHIEWYVIYVQTHFSMSKYDV